MSDSLSFFSIRLKDVATEITKLIERQGKVAYTFSWGEEEHYVYYSTETLNILKDMICELNVMSEKYRILYKFTEGDIGENEFIDQINVITETAKTKEEA